jgi:6-phosphofructokinase 1
LASRFGNGAIEAIAREEFGVLVGLNKGAVTTTPLEEVVGKTKEISMEMVKLADLLD